MLIYSEYNSAFSSSPSMRDISFGLISVGSDFILLLSMVNGCVLGIRLYDPL